MYMIHFMQINARTDKIIKSQLCHHHNHQQPYCLFHYVIKYIMHKTNEFYNHVNVKQLGIFLLQNKDLNSHFPESDL
jgi:hypothetical protein